MGMGWGDGERMEEEGEWKLKKGRRYDRGETG